MRVFIKTYGCTLNQADSDIMRGLLTESGAEMVDGWQDADVVVVNTCTVKTPTQEKELYEIGRLERAGKRIVVAGCMASANPGLVSRRAPSAGIVTTSNIGRISEAVAAAAGGTRAVIAGYSRVDKLDMLKDHRGVIAKVPVSEGCLSSCGFCETKFARGPLNSFGEDSIVKAVEMCAAGGAKEIQLTSQDMGAYGADRGTDVARLMERINRIDGDFKVRVGMLNPEHLGRYIDRFVRALEGERFYKFVHLPVQSGSDSVLGSMRRNYTVGQFEGYVERIRDLIPDATIETDIIVGYPTETERDFADTISMVERVRPNVVNRCRFWARPHATASAMKQLGARTIAGRSIRLTRAVRAVQQGINNRFVGSSEEVIVTEDDGMSVTARTGTYKKVVLGGFSARPQLGSRLRVVFTAASSNVLYGSVRYNYNHGS